MYIRQMFDKVRHQAIFSFKDKKIAVREKYIKLYDCNMGGDIIDKLCVVFHGYSGIYLCIVYRKHGKVIRKCH